MVGKAGRADTPTDPAPMDMIETVVNLRPREEWPRRAVGEAKLLDAARAALPGAEGQHEEVARDAGLRFDARARDIALGHLRDGTADAIDDDLQSQARSLFAAALREAAAARGLRLDEARLPRWVLLARKSKADLVRELDGIAQVPGWSNIWTEPIINRVDMLATGIRTQVGVKVFGDDPARIQSAANDIAAALRQVPGAVDVFPDQIAGKGYLEIAVDRERAARQGVSAADVNEAIETALGGKPVTTALKGRQRLPVRVRYAQGFRDDEEQVGRVLVGRVPLAQVARVVTVLGPALIKSENGILCAYVQLNVHGRDLRGFVEEAQARIARSVALPPGVFVQWGGQFEHEISARRTLSIVFPIVILLIFLILYWTYRDLGDAALMMLAVPGALVGGLICQRLMGFQFSVAVWVGYIACFGLATETGIVMLVYLREAIDRRGGLAAIGSVDELREAVAAGAVQRLRPKLLTEGLIVLSLLPMLWSSGVGARSCGRWRRRCWAGSSSPTRSSTSPSRCSSSGCASAAGCASRARRHRSPRTSRSSARGARSARDRRNPARAHRQNDEGPDGNTHRAPRSLLDQDPDQGQAPSVQGGGGGGAFTTSVTDVVRDSVPLVPVMVSG
ncbi:MAG: hypothetical protein NVS4B10_01330 [Myxococcales bacterium]